MKLELRSRKNALKSAVNMLLKEKNTIGYAKTALEAFDEIQSLRAKGVRFDKICKAFEATGLLPENASVHSFQQAFLRE